MVDEWRHTTSNIPSIALGELIKQCWQSDARSRQSFSQIVKKHRVEVVMTKTPPIGSTATLPNKGFGSSDMDGQDIYKWYFPINLGGNPIGISK